MSILSLPSAFGLAAGQLADRAILAVLVKSVAITLLILIAIGFAVGALAQDFAGYLELAVGPEFGTLVSIVAALLGGWLLFRIVALAVLPFFGDDIVAAVERRHYPAARNSARTRNWREETGESLRATGLTLAVNGAALLLSIPLLLTAIGPALLFFVANAWLLGRELVALTANRHTADVQVGPATRLALGAITAGLAIVPFVNLLAPVLGAAAACHLVHRKAAKTVTSPSAPASSSNTV